MREMKDSEASWLGMIPTEWELKKINSLYSLRNTKVSDRDYSPLSVTMKGVVPQLESAAKTNAHDDRKLVKKGDFAINSRSDRRGSCGISDMDGSVSLINTVLKPNQELNPKYYNWLFHTVQFADEFYANGHGIVNDLWTTTWQDMKKILTPSPPLEEQQRIANFLDEKCGEINSLTEDIQEQIETLEEYKKSVITEAVTKGLDPNVEMKDSGIPYIDNINIHWNVSEFKFVVAEKVDNRGRTPELSDDEKDIPLVEVNAVGGKHPDVSQVKKYISIDSYKKYIRNDLKSGDIIVTTVGATIGKCSVVPKFFNYCIAQNLVAYRVNDNNYPLFWFYYFKSQIFQDMFAQFDKTNTINNVKISNMEQGKVVVPTLCEQKEIAHYLDIKCAKIDKTIQTKKEQLDVLAEYKKSLIYEYVTGKKEVPVNE